MGATIKRCKRCGAIFGSYGADCCAKCAEELDELFTKIQDYLYDHDTAGVVEISEALNIDGKIILDFIKDGSLALNEGSYAINCDRCNKPISSGRYCSECKEELSSIFENAASSHKQEEIEKKKKVRMHIRHDD